MQTPSSILLIDDSPGECELFRLALGKTGLDVALYVEQNPDAALHFLRNEPQLPSVVLLDWRIRNCSGNEFLTHLRTDVRLATIPIVIFTTSDTLSDIAGSYASGANGYVVKPGTFDDLVRCIGDLCRYWLTRNRTPYVVKTRC
jgi:CheY-like chemotaxis protein